jgi:hypothetical protein
MQLETLQKEKKLSDEYYANLLRLRPVIGRSISSLDEMPKEPPTEDEINLLTKRKVEYDYHAMSVSRICWFRSGDTAALRATYLGFGGMTILLMSRSEEDQEAAKQLGQLISRFKLPAFLRKDARLVAMVEGLDPQNPFRPPPFIRNHPAMANLNAVMGPEKRDSQGQMRRVMFGLKTKEMFGGSMKTDPAYAGIPFLLPKLASAEIFHSTPEERASWFELFEAYLTESPADGGMLLLTRCEFLPEIVEVIASLRNDGYIYWEG